MGICKTIKRMLGLGSKKSRSKKREEEEAEAKSRYTYTGSILLGPCTSRTSSFSKFREMSSSTILTGRSIAAILAKNCSLTDQRVMNH